MNGSRDDVTMEIDRALDTLGVPHLDATGTRLSQDDRLNLWVRDPRAGRFKTARPRAAPSTPVA
jgi:hypothetical protein